MNTLFDKILNGVPRKNEDGIYLPEKAVQEDTAN